MKNIGLCMALILLSTSVLAQSRTDSDIKVEGNACEEQKNNETQASLRARVTDKASFVGVESLPQVVKYKNNLNQHDFNVMVYSLIDEFLEEISVQTISEDDGKICVSVSGNIKSYNLEDGIANFLKDRKEENPTDAVIETVIDENNMQSQLKADEKEPEAPKVSAEDMGLVYIAPTEFYNGAMSENHSRLIKHQLGKSAYFFITDDKSIADYLIYPKVSKAKIEKVGKDSSRLQLEVSFVLKSADEMEIFKDGQSRVTVFDNSQSEQKEAQNLLKNMFAKSGRLMLAKLENMQKAKLSAKPAAITK